MYNISTLNPIKIAVVFLNMVSIPVHVLSAGVFYNALNTKTVASLFKGSYLYVYIKFGNSYLHWFYLQIDVNVI